MSEGRPLTAGEQHAYSQGYNAGAVGQRDAIVAWLRERAAQRWGDAVDYAEDIESGQHLRGIDG